MENILIKKKKMKKGIFIFLILSSSIIATGQNSSGICFLQNGTTIAFKEVIGISSDIHSTSYSNMKNSLRCMYNGTERDIPFDKIKSIEVTDYDVYVPHTGPLSEPSIIINIDIKVITKTGIEFETTLKRLTYIKFKIYDELTGSNTNQLINFFEKQSNWRLNIKKIVIN